MSHAASFKVTARGRTIGVVIPAYNRGNLLPATLEAVLAQTRPADTVMVVDDGSTDHTPAVLAAYSDRVKSIRIINSGDLAARNIGLSSLKTDLVAFCDSDDVWRPTFLEEMGRLWDEEPETKVAYSDFVIIDDDDVWGSQSKFELAPARFWSGLRHLGPDAGVFDGPVVERLIEFQPFFPSCMVADMAFFRRLGGWDEGVSRIVGCDFATALRVAEHPPIGVVRKPLVGIRKHATNFSADVQKMNLGDAAVLEHVLHTRPSLAQHAALIRGSVIKRRQQALATAFARNDLKSVRDIYAMLPDYARGNSIRVKYAIAALPSPLASVVGALALAAGSGKSRMAPAGHGEASGARHAGARSSATH